MTDNINTPTDEYHVASLVAYCMQDQIGEVTQAINAIEGAEIHATSVEGKIVLTLEGDSHKTIGKRMDQLRIHQGLINLSPVYHQVLDEGQ
ncbi:chaperone NapD [Colwellia asteriadis]|uniref:Chaperone NapD n=1 Tax=Colwellia asteriadis TaxID=517723 RepID=A0ABN1L8N4_9GAMM